MPDTPQYNFTGLRLKSDDADPGGKKKDSYNFSGLKKKTSSRVDPDIISGLSNIITPTVASTTEVAASLQPESPGLKKGLEQAYTEHPELKPRLPQPPMESPGEAITRNMQNGIAKDALKESIDAVLAPPQAVESGILRAGEEGKKALELIKTSPRGLPPEALVRIVLGAGEAAFGAAMGTTPVGVGMTIGQKELPKISPELAKATDMLFSPASSTVKYLAGRKPEGLAGALTELGDLAGNILLFKGFDAGAESIREKMLGGEKLSPVDQEKLSPEINAVYDKVIEKPTERQTPTPTEIIDRASKTAPTTAQMMTVKHGNNTPFNKIEQRLYDASLKAILSEREVEKPTEGGTNVPETPPEPSKTPAPAVETPVKSEQLPDEGTKAPITQPQAKTPEMMTRDEFAREHYFRGYHGSMKSSEGLASPGIYSLSDWEKSFPGKYSQGGGISIFHTSQMDRSQFEKTRDLGTSDLYPIKGEKPRYVIPGDVDPHKYFVGKSLSEGKKIPSEVLKDYPDLQTKAPISERGAISPLTDEQRENAQQMLVDSGEKVRDVIKLGDSELRALAEKKGIDIQGKPKEYGTTVAGEVPKEVSDAITQGGGGGKIVYYEPSKGVKWVQFDDPISRSTLYIDTKKLSRENVSAQILAHRKLEFPQFNALREIGVPQSEIDTITPEVAAEKLKISVDDLNHMTSANWKGIADKVKDESLAVKPVTTGWEKGVERLFVYDPNSTENEGRFRLRPPSDIRSDSYFRRKSSVPGVSYVMGKDAKTGKNVVQAVRFDKNILNETQAKGWWEKNKDRSEFQRSMPTTPSVKLPEQMTKAEFEKSPDMLTIYDYQTGKLFVVPGKGYTHATYADKLLSDNSIKSLDYVEGGFIRKGKYVPAWTEPGVKTLPEEMQKSPTDPYKMLIEQAGTKRGPSVDELKQQLANIATTGEGVSVSGIKQARELADQSKDLFTTAQRSEIASFIEDLQKQLKELKPEKPSVLTKEDISKRQAELDKLTEDFRRKYDSDLIIEGEPGATLAAGIIPGLTPEATERFAKIATENLKNAAPAIKSFLEDSQKGSEAAGNIADDLYKLQTNNKADIIRARQTLDNVDVDPKDDQAAYHYSENNTEKITPEQREYYDKNIKPLKDEVERIKAKVKGVVPTDTDNFNTRIVRDKGSALQRIAEGTKSTLQQGTILGRQAGFLKKRTMRVAIDESGNREVVSVKDRKVTKWKNGKPESLGKIKFKSREELLDQDLKPIDKQVGDLSERLSGLRERSNPIQERINKINNEIDILNKSKGRAWESRHRIMNLRKTVADLETKKDSPENRYDAITKKSIKETEEKLDNLRTQRDDVLNQNDPNTLNQKVFVDKNGNRWTLGDATTKEIETNTDLKYYKSALATNLLAYTKARQIERAFDLMESYKSDPSFVDIAKKYGDPETPSDFKPTKLLNFAGYTFDPKVADVLDRFADQFQRGRNPMDVLTSANLFLRTSIFFNPLIHVPNISVHWLVNRGASAFASPTAYKTLWRTGTRAIDAVVHQNADYVEMLEHGAPLQYKTGESVTDLLLKKSGLELEQDPTLAGELSKLFGYANPAKLIKAVYDFSGRATWASNDVATMQAIYEEMSHGKSMDQAIQNVGKHIPNYRIPARILNSTNVSKLLSNPNLTMFGAYHYGALKSYWEMVKSVVKPEEGTRERLGAIDKMAMLGITMAVIYPMLDRVARTITGNENARFRRAGAATVPYNIYKLSQGQLDLSDLLFSIVTPAVATKEAVQLAVNRDLYSGKRIYRSKDIIENPLAFVTEAVPSALKTVAPVGAYERIASGKTDLPSYMESLVGIQQPKSNALTPEGYDEIQRLIRLHRRQPSDVRESIK